MVSSLSDVYRSVEAEMHQVEAEMNRAVQTLTPQLAEAAAYSLARSGKRIRPLVTILTSKLGKSDCAAVVKVAAALELVHLGSLVHDDIVDDAQLRRGRPSVNAQFGSQTAVLLGDFLFARALGLAGEVGLSAVQVVSSVISSLVEGELTQLSSSFDTSISFEDYYSRIRQKTAWFLAECCRAGGLFSSGGPLSPDELHAYGLNVGLAFQVKDDLLDFTSESFTLGKPTMLDLRQGVITLPVIHALANHPRREEISAWIRAQRAEQWGTIRSCLVEVGSLEFAEQQASELIAKAKRELERAPDHDAKTALLVLADFVLSRVS